MNQIMVVEYRGTDLYGFQLGGVVHVGLKPIVEAMGLEWSAQLKRIKRDPILSKGMAMMAIPSGRGGKQEHVCLRLDLLHGWLFTIDSTRVRKSIRETVQTFQEECYAVLYAHFASDSEKLLQQRQESDSLKVRLVTEARQTFDQTAAQQLWKELELPWVPAMAKGLAQLAFDFQQPAESEQSSRAG